MEIQPIVVGTAGHIDHGKSTLVRALTGIDPDRLKEERERGMTIDLGFARFQLPDGRRVGMVDVPGHERFIKNMVAGASGIDLVVLVVAADDGVMPQTREHLAIMQILGVRRGLVALSKVDMVEPGMVELAREDVREATRGTFLEDAPLLPVSAVSGTGMEEFKTLLFRMAAETPPRSPSGIFRMPVQRVFSAKGFGTVVTGIPVSGQVTIGDTLEVLPGARRCKVRGIQAYSSSEERARAGHSAAINLTDLAVEDVHRGYVVATPGFFRPTRMLAATLECLPGLGWSLEDRLEIRLHTGTVEALGELVLLDCESVEPGGKALIQLRLEEPVVCAPGDRYVLRLASPAVTLGGGSILEESRHRLKRFKGFVLEELGRVAGGLQTPQELLEVVLSRAGARLVSQDELAVEIKRDRGETARLLDQLRGAGKVYRLGSRGWIHTDQLGSARERLAAVLAAWFEQNPHRRVVDVRELRRKTGFEDEFLSSLLEFEQAQDTLELQPGGLVRVAGKDDHVDPVMSSEGQRVVAALARQPYQPPAPAALAAELGLAPRRVDAVLEFLVDRGEVQRVQPELFMTRESFERARQAVIENCAQNGSLDIPSLRDRLQTTRKYLIPLLEHFDAIGVTLRQGANRVLRKR